MENDAITVRNDPDRHRYELLDGDSVIGAAHWVPREGPDGPERIFHHTVVDDAYTGRGLASQLVRSALDDTAEAGESVVPVCRFVKSWLEDHPDHQARVVEVRKEHLVAVRGPQPGE